MQKQIERDAELLREGADPAIQSALDEVVERSRLAAPLKPRRSGLRHRICAALLIIAAFIPVGLYSQKSYVAPDTTIMRRPFERITGNSYTSFHLVPGTIGDSSEFPERSTLELYEDDKKLGPAHSAHVDITAKGNGAYSQWFTGNEGYIIIFSSSDNSDPNTNGRTYRAVNRAAR